MEAFQGLLEFLHKFLEGVLQEFFQRFFQLIFGILPEIFRGIPSAIYLHMSHEFIKGFIQKLLQKFFNRFYRNVSYICYGISFGNPIQLPSVIFTTIPLQFSHILFQDFPQRFFHQFFHRFAPSDLPKIHIAVLQIKYSKIHFRVFEEIRESIFPGNSTIILQEAHTQIFFSYSTCHLHQDSLSSVCLNSRLYSKFLQRLFQEIY